ncbi:hypothetical protein HPB48_011298 [Haemaphysalis longicornis]|uniref:Uncharacterized protein n=1 Tax=Haemaphysalis longicornis TaxID=44386 RepID=A0A9J6GTW7_HAELO|nr:hypothetical protein HPB48_011298 [Haemaphysalis longicornis]
MYSRMCALQGVQSNLRKLMPTQILQPRQAIEDCRRGTQERKEWRRKKPIEGKATGAVEDFHIDVNDARTLIVTSPLYIPPPAIRPKARNTSSNREGHAWSDKPWSHPPARQTSATKQTSSGRLLPGVEKTSSKSQQHGQVQPHLPPCLGDIYQQIILEF